MNLPPKRGAYSELMQAISRLPEPMHAATYCLNHCHPDRQTVVLARICGPERVVRSGSSRKSRDSPMLLSCSTHCVLPKSCPKHIGVCKSHWYSNTRRTPSSATESRGCVPAARPVTERTRWQAGSSFIAWLERLCSSELQNTAQHKEDKSCIPVCLDRHLHRLYSFYVGMSHSRAALKLADNPPPCAPAHICTPSRAPTLPSQTKMSLLSRRIFIAVCYVQLHRPRLIGTAFFCRFVTFGGLLSLQKGQEHVLRYINPKVCAEGTGTSHVFFDYVDERKLFHTPCSSRVARQCVRRCTVSLRC